MLPTRIWRLSPTQYVNTVSSVFGVKLPIESVSGDGKSDAVQMPRGFDTDANENKVYDALGAAYTENATQVATMVMSSLKGTDGCVKMANATTSCIEGFVRRYAEPAFRRPLKAEEVSAYVAFYNTNAKAHTPDEAGRMALEAILQSPHFLYRAELGDGATAAGDAPVKLSHHELAAQISYLIADVPPAAVPELVQAAKDQQLDKPATVRAMAEKLAQLPEARAKLGQFFTYYMPYYRDFMGADPNASKSPDKFKTFAALKPAMVEETKTFLDKVLATTPTLTALFGTNKSYVNSALATHYGAKGVTGDSFVEAEVPNRAGLLTQGSVIAAMSQFDTTSPVHRGLFFYETVLCNHPAPPPPNVATQRDRLNDKKDPMATERQKFEYFKANEEAQCVACHTPFQPLGLGLESFDPIGRYRATENDRPIDATVEVSADIGGADLAGTYKNGIELMAAALKSEKGRSCFVSKYMSFAFGIDAESDADKCAVRRLSSKFSDAGLDLTKLLVESTQESSFFYRQAVK